MGDYGTDLKEDHLEEGCGWVWEINGNQYGEIERIYGKDNKIGFQNGEDKDILRLKADDGINDTYAELLRDITRSEPSGNLFENYGRIAVYRDGEPKAIGLCRREADMLNREFGPLLNEALEKINKLKQV